MFGDDRLPVRFWSKVVVAVDGCWLWTAGLTTTGYSKYTHCGRTDLGHRVAYSELVGPIPDDLEIDHLCRRRNCVNPAHMEPVTAQTNMRRSNAPCAFNAAKTHCKNGHPLEDGNLVPSKLKVGERACLICFRDYDREAKRKRRARRHASEEARG